MELYVHIPFCRQKCRYCSFTSFAGRETEAEAYIDLLLREAALRRRTHAEPVTTVYIGGGTPSLLPSEAFGKLLDGLDSLFCFANTTEFTAEANPGTVTPEWLKTAADHGLNRLSFGMQAAQDSLLSILGRIHRFDDVRRSVEMARASGIRNINLDLIFGIPSQDLLQWEKTLEAALSLNPDHISAYGLIPEDGTPLAEDLATGLLSLPDPDLEREMYDCAIEFLAGHGLFQYEISNFAKKGYECAHNKGYWTQVPYLGLGLSAASMDRVRISSGGMTYRRSVNSSCPENYRKMVTGSEEPEETEWILPADARFETMMLGLRMNGGVDELRFLSLHGMTVEESFGHKLSELEEKGLLLHENGRWKMTRRGFDIQNSILVELMEDPDHI